MCFERVKLGFKKVIFGIIQIDHLAMIVNNLIMEV